MKNLKSIIRGILLKIAAHDEQFINENQNPVVMTRKMVRIAKRYVILSQLYGKMEQETYDQHMDRLYGNDRMFI